MNFNYLFGTPAPKPPNPMTLDHRTIVAEEAGGILTLNGKPVAAIAVDNLTTQEAALIMLALKIGLQMHADVLDSQDGCAMLRDIGVMK